MDTVSLKHLFKISVLVGVHLHMGGGLEKLGLKGHQRLKLLIMMVSSVSR